MKQTRIHCPYCGSLATLRPASAIHGLSDISAGTYLYVCRRWPTCDAYVTADRRMKQPLGTLPTVTYGINASLPTTHCTVYRRSLA